MKKAAKAAVESTATEATITFNDKVYVISALPQEVQELINIHQSWSVELGEQRREVFKIEAALRGLLIELETRFKVVDLATTEATEVTA